MHFNRHLYKAYVICRLNQNKNEFSRKIKVKKAAKVGETCTCPSCGTKFVKTNYQQAFCKSRPGTKCKDYYWNQVDPKKRNNTTRISPASAAWLEQKRDERDMRYTSGYYEHPFSSEALGQD